MRSEPPTGDDLTRMLVSMKRNVLNQAAAEPAPARRSTKTDRIVGGVLGAALLVGVAAGAAFVFGVAPVGQYSMDPAATTSPTPTASPTPTPTPTEPPPSDYAVAPGTPESRYGLACETLVDPALVSNLFTTDVAPADPIVTASGIGIAIPRVTSILSVGGTACEWSNGAPENHQYGTNPDYVGVTVMVVPRPAAGWSERATQYGLPDDRNQCDPEATLDAFALCEGSAAVGDAWVVVSAFGGAGTIEASGWQPFFDAIIDAVTAAGPAAPPTALEHVGTPPVQDCEAVLPLDTVRSVTGTPEPETRRSGGGGWSAWAEARQTAGNTGCMWTIFDADLAAGVDWVNDGRSAFERMLQAGTTSPVEVAGLSADDAAVIRCSSEPYGQSCAVDLGIGRNWYNVTGGDRDTAIALAEAVLAQLQG